MPTKKKPYKNKHFFTQIQENFYYVAEQNNEIKNKWNKIITNKFNIF